MPSISDLIAGLWQLVLDAISWFFCAVVDFLMGVLLLIIQWMFGFMPNPAPPTWLSSNMPGAESLQLLAFFFPMGILFWASGLYLVFEAWYAVVVPLYRAVMDLF